MRAVLVSVRCVCVCMQALWWMEPMHDVISQEVTSPAGLERKSVSSQERVKPGRSPIVVLGHVSVRLHEPAIS